MHDALNGCRNFAYIVDIFFVDSAVRQGGDRIRLYTDPSLDSDSSKSLTVVELISIPTRVAFLPLIILSKTDMD